MKDTDRITSMVCTSAKGIKCSIAYVGRAKCPRCFSGANDEIFKRYTSNKTVWFNKGVTQWWFSDIFVPWFCRNF